MTDPYIKKSKSDNWGTPQHIKERFKDYYDPCPYKYEIDGLTSEWREYNFVNPPYSKLSVWSLKIQEEYKKNKKIVLLIPARTDTKYFHDILLKCNPTIEYIKGRLKYVDLDNSSKNMGAAPFPSILMFFT